MKTTFYCPFWTKLKVCSFLTHEIKRGGRNSDADVNSFYLNILVFDIAVIITDGDLPETTVQPTQSSESGNMKQEAVTKATTVWVRCPR